MMQRNGDSLNRVGLVVLGAGLGGLILWLGVRGSTWLTRELAYQRWRRQRFHPILLGPPAAGLAQHLASGRALVWDGGKSHARP